MCVEAETLQSHGGFLQRCAVNFTCSWDDLIHWRISQPPFPLLRPVSVSLTLHLSVLCSSVYTHTHTHRQNTHTLPLYLSLHLSSSFSHWKGGNRVGWNDRVRGFTEDWLFIIVFGPLNSDSNRMRWGEKRVPLITVSGGPEPSGDASISHVPGRGTQSDFQASRPRSAAVQPPSSGCWWMKSAGGGGGGRSGRLFTLNLLQMFWHIAPTASPCYQQT